MIHGGCRDHVEFNLQVEEVPPPGPTCAISDLESVSTCLNALAPDSKQDLTVSTFLEALSPTKVECTILKESAQPGSRDNPRCVAEFEATEEAKESLKLSWVTDPQNNLLHISFGTNYAVYAEFVLGSNPVFEVSKSFALAYPRNDDGCLRCHDPHFGKPLRIVKSERYKVYLLNRLPIDPGMTGINEHILQLAKDCQLEASERCKRLRVTSKLINSLNDVE